MFKRHPRAVIGTVTASLTVAAFGVAAGPALATCPVGSVCTSGEVVAGTTLSSIALSASGTVGTPVLFTNLAPGNTAQASGALTAVDTNPTWTLQVQDSGAGAGKMVQTGGTCTHSESQLSTPLTVGLTAPLSGLPTGTGVSVASPGTLSGTPLTVATNTSGAGGQLLDGNQFTTNYSVTIPNSDVMAAGCIYGLTATYTLQ